ncbi:TBP domain superfamily [Babesia duncani]|uniref:TBP domain superfamily n=1 Tax=Babesia duncani TaxID=323732 RepID=A0AAD9PIL3_9APIC|nr:TBP domain superfamily [Babesia duncani]
MSDTRDLVLNVSLEVSSATVCVVWASAMINYGGFKGQELLKIARSFARSEYSKSSVKITLLRPYALCRIYLNGKVSLMGTLSEHEAKVHISRVLYKLRNRTSWRYSRARSLENGAKWNFTENPKMLKVKEALKTFKIDQLYARVILKDPLDLDAIYARAIAADVVASFQGQNTLRIVIPLADVSQIDKVVTWDSHLELEMELEAELENLTSLGVPSATLLVHKSAKVAIFGCSRREDIVYAMQQFATFFKLQ